MKNRLLTLEDLYDFYSGSSSTIHFSAQDDDKNIVVQVGGNMTFEDNVDSAEDLTKVRLQSCHTLRNRNNTYIAEDVMTTALPSFSNRPILAYIHEVDGQEEFYKHNMHQDDDGEIVYDEKPVGVIPESCNAHLEYDEDKQHMYVVVDGYLYDQYSHATEILKREKECYVSVELSIRELEYNAKEKYLDIKDFFFSGVTILGKTPDGNTVEPGMDGANIKLFSDNNEVVTADNVDAIQNFQEGGKPEVSKFEELLEKYGKTEEDIDFDYEDLSDEELEAKFAEMFDEAESEGSEEDGGEPQPEGFDEEEGSEEGEEELFSKVFSISHEDIKAALYGLLSVYEEADNDWYYISAVYDDYFAYEGWCTGAIYGQKYTTDGDNVVFDGERYALHRELLTDSEYATLKDMRENYEAISEKLAKYEAEPDKMEILTSSDYSQISEVEAFVKLSEVENHFDLSVEEVRNKADAILLDYAKNTKLEFAANSEESGKKVTSKHMPQIKTKTSRYGNLFSK